MPTDKPAGGRVAPAPELAAEAADPKQQQPQAEAADAVDKDKAAATEKPRSAVPDAFAAASGQNKQESPVSDPDTIVIVSPRGWTLNDNAGGAVIRPGQNRIPARFRNHWALRAHGCGVVEA